MLSDFFRVTPKSRSVKLKRKNGILFRNPGIVGKTVFYAGTWLLIGAMGYGVYLYWPLGKAILNYWDYQNSKVASAGSGSGSVVAPTPTITEVTSKEYSITIPKIGAYAKIESDISPFDPKEYLSVLKENTVAHAKGTDKVDSGKGTSSYIFAHSTEQGVGMARKNAVFYLLGELKNDDVVFVNNHGKILRYKVYKQQIVNASQTEFLKYKESEKEIIILQTCWPIGTDWKRLLVFVERI